LIIYVQKNHCNPIAIVVVDAAAGCREKKI
jgi:hypothetical protein